MIKNPLLEKIKAKKTALGCRCTNPDMVELCAYLGLDWFQIDMMWTPCDWSGVNQMILTGEAAGITPTVRLQSYPWLGYDHRVPVDVSRAGGIGAQFVQMSYSSKKEIEEAVLVSKDWHRKATLIHQIEESEWDKKVDEMAERNFIIPAAETEGAFKDLEAVLAMPDIKIFFFSMTDASKVISRQKKPDWYNAKLWKYIAKAVKIGEKNGVIIGANTSYGDTMKEMRERVKHLHEAGIKMIMMQGSNYLFQTAMREFLGGVREDLKLN